MRGGIFKASAIGALLVVLPVVLLLTAAKGGATVAAGASFHSSTSPSGPTVYVSPAGNDAAAGTRLKPFRTLQRARNYVRTINRNMSRDITVYLKGGTYRLPQTLTFTSRDSGTNAHNVIWTAFGSAMPVISGAVRITGWKLSNPSMDMWAAAVPKGFSTRQVYVDGVRAVLDSGLPPTTFRRTPTGYIASTPIMSGWRNPREIDFVYATQLGKMTDPMCPVAAMKGTTITMAQPCWDNSTRRVSTLVGPPSVWFPTSIENAYELLDKPGQFYLDGSAHRLYYIPRSGQNMRTADVETPVLTTLLSGKGTTATPIHNIVFANLQFSFATWLQPGTPQGFSEVQAGYTLTGDHAFATEGLCGQAIHGTCPYGNWTKEPAGIQFSFDRKLSFINDRFLHLGAAAINLDVGSQAGTIARSIFTDISGNGIEIGGVGNPNARGPSQTASMLVTDNHLYGLPAEYHGGVAILTGYMADSIISHNQIDHISYSAISTGWGGWPNKLGLPPVANFSHDNIVSDNLIYDFMLDSSDGGGVYSQGITGPSMAHGELVTGNVIHDQLTWSDALKSDDGATFVHYTRNVTYDNAYDWGWSQGDYIQSRGKFDQQLVRNNYWQQGFPQASILGITASDNSIIAGVEQAPKAIVAGAGIEPRFRGILAWRPTGVAEPAPPDQVTT
ncbi:MAG TPA: right-handed parallel beta-helix repeat-containing protein, partial [Chloroflexota bacterium]|nr:right-handed parallel beta-helix repeat-containing protein [Chloroflexota bacterium]